MKSKHFSNQIEEKDQANNNSISDSKKACCHETICLDWFYHLSCTYAHSQSSLKRFLCRNVHVYIKTITDYIFRRSPHFLFRSFVYISTCVCVCLYPHDGDVFVCVHGFLLYFFFFLALIDNRLLCFHVLHQRKKNETLNASSQMLHIISTTKSMLWVSRAYQVQNKPNTKLFVSRTKFAKYIQKKTTIHNFKRNE